MENKTKTIKSTVISLIIIAVFLSPFIPLHLWFMMKILPEPSGVIERLGQSLIVWSLFMGVVGLACKLFEKVRDEIELLGLAKAMFSSILKVAFFSLVLTIWLILLSWFATFETFKNHATSFALGMVGLLLVIFIFLGVNLFDVIFFFFKRGKTSDSGN